MTTPTPKRAPFKRQTGAVAPSPVTSPAPEARRAASAGPVLPDAGLVRQAVRSSPGAWFESYGCILDKDRNLLSFPRLNKMQQELDDIVNYCDRKGIPCRIVTLKGRQQGSSTWSTAGLYHFCRKKRTKAVIIGDVYERSVANLQAMFDTFAEKDAFDWGNTYHRPSGKFSHGSELKTETANANRAGASGTFQAVLCTEVAHWKETPGISAKSVFAALMSCVPKRAGTLVIVESTPNGVGGVYYDTYAKAITFEDLKAEKIPHDWNGFVKVFYPWHEHPEYLLEVTPKQEREIMDSLTQREEELVEEFPHVRGARLAWRRMKINDVDFNGDEERFEQEYPSDPERCFLLSGRRSFPLLPLQQMLKVAEREGQEGLHPKMLKWTDARESGAALLPCADEQAFIKVWEKPKAGLRYSVAVDPMTGAAHGGDPDNHGIGVWRAGYYCTEGRWFPPKMVARVTDYLAEKRLGFEKPSCRWDIALTEERIAMVAAYYGWCQIVVEVNMDRGIIELLKQRPRARLYVREIFNRVEQTNGNEFGWMTTEKTRRPIIEGLKRAVRVWQVDGDGVCIYDVPTIREMMTMVVLDNGREEAMRGHHDDQVLAAAIGLQTLPGATVMPVPRAQFQPQLGKPRDSTFRP